MSNYSIIIAMWLRLFYSLEAGGGGGSVTMNMVMSNGFLFYEHTRYASIELWDESWQMTLG